MNKSASIVTLALLAAFSFFGALAAAQSFPPLLPKDAAAMGLGGSFISLSSGYSSFYGNPAGFASDKGEFTIADVKTWAYLKPTAANISAATSLLKGGMSESDTISTLNGLLTQNGFGGGFSFGLGYAGKGLGVGLYAVSDEVASGNTAMGSTLSSSTMINAVIGLGVPVKLGGLRLDIGGDARPYYRMDSVEGGWGLPDLLTNRDLSSEPVYAGFNLAMDFGASLQVNRFRFGLALRDISPTYLMGRYTIGELLTGLSSGGLPSPGSDAATASTPPFIAAGAAWQPVLVPHIVEPALYFEVQDPVGIYDNGDSVWELLHLGAEVKLINLVSLRAGINRGWLSAGVGLDLFFMKIDASVFTEELGRHPGDDPRTGIALQAAIRL